MDSETWADVQEQYDIITDRNGLKDAITGDRTQKLFVKMLTKLVQPHQFRLLLERDVDRESTKLVSRCFQLFFNLKSDYNAMMMCCEDAATVCCTEDYGDYRPGEPEGDGDDWTSEADGDDSEWTRTPDD